MFSVISDQVFMQSQSVGHTFLNKSPKLELGNDY